MSTVPAAGVSLGLGAGDSTTRVPLPGVGQLVAEARPVSGAVAGLSAGE